MTSDVHGAGQQPGAGTQSSSFAHELSSVRGSSARTGSRVPASPRATSTLDSRGETVAPGCRQPVDETTLASAKADPTSVSSRLMAPTASEPASPFGPKRDVPGERGVDDGEDPVAIPR